MRRRWKLLALLAAGALLTAVLTHHGAHQPTYNGRTLSSWVNAYGNYPAMKAPPAKDAAADAIRQIGTNALPYLLAWINYEPSPWRRKLQAFSRRLPSALVENRFVEHVLSYGDGYTLAQNATQAFAILGPIAAPAAPELRRRIVTKGPTDSRYRALAAIAQTGPPAVPAIAQVLSNASDAASMWVTFCIEDLGTNAKPLVPILLQNLRHTNPDVVVQSIYTLSQLQLDATNVVPALAACLRHPDRNVRFSTPCSLAKFGALAHPALAALTNALSDADADVRREVAEAISKIAAEPLTHALPQ